MAEKNNTQRLLWAGLIVALLAIGIYALNDWLRSQEITEPSREIPVLGTVPEFTLTDQSGKPFGTADLKGKIYLIFTNCAGTCPMMTAEMAALQKSLRKTPDVHLVSISVDPNNDKPEILADYAKKYNADLTTWHFLTGKVSTIYTVAKDGFKMTVDSVSEDVMNPILHSERFALVDKKGRIRAFYTGTEPESKGKLLTDIGDLLREEKIEAEKAQ
jgi:cytochrome oxidase Cu insertion factor (SCO1/SenC/PrrC family)